MTQSIPAGVKIRLKIWVTSRASVSIPRGHVQVSLKKTTTTFLHPHQSSINRSPCTSCLYPGSKCGPAGLPFPPPLSSPSLPRSPALTLLLFLYPLPPPPYSCNTFNHRTNRGLSSPLGKLSLSLYPPAPPVYDRLSVCRGVRT